MTVCYLAALVSDETYGYLVHLAVPWYMWMFLGISRCSLVYVDVALYGWNDWHFPATIGGSLAQLAL